MSEQTKPRSPAELRELADSTAATVRNQDELRHATTGSYLIAAAILDVGASLAEQLKRIADELEFRR